MAQGGGMEGGNPLMTAMFGMVPGMLAGQKGGQQPPLPGPAMPGQPRPGELPGMDQRRPDMFR